MGRIPEETIQAIRDRVDIVDLVGRHVTLRQTGRSYKALCPFHDEKTPSFHVHPERQIFHCFGCGVGGNVFTFLVQHENLSFPEAVRLLGRECGIEVPEEGGGEPGVAERLREANEVAARLFRETLAGREGESARRYLGDRALGAEEIERYGLGYAPARWDGVVRALGRARISAAIGERAGLLAPRSGGGHYDRLRGRVVFPIRDVRGAVVGFGGRALGADQEPKYLNTPESPIFRKREAFYGFPEALEPMRRRGRAVVVEGYFDRIALELAGVPETVATCGTALTPDHARNLRRRAPEVVLFFDGDEAGRRAMERALDVLLPEGLRVRAAELPPGDDPDTFLRREGPEALRRRVDEAPPALEVAIRWAAARGKASPWEKADAVSSVAGLVARVPDPVEQGEFVRRLAFVTDTRVDEVEAVVRRVRRGEHAAAEVSPAEAGPRRRSPEARFAERLARLLVERPEQAARLDRQEIAGLVEEPPWSAVLPALVDTLAGVGSDEGGGGAHLDLAGLAETLGGHARAALLAIAASDDELLAAGDDPDRVLDDTLRGLRERRRARERRALTRRLATETDVDAAALLAEKQRQLEERRAALGIRPPPTPARP